MSAKSDQHSTFSQCECTCLVAVFQGLLHDPIKLVHLGSLLLPGVNEFSHKQFLAQCGPGIFRVTAIGGRTVTLQYRATLYWVDLKKEKRKKDIFHSCLLIWNMIHYQTSETSKVVFALIMNYTTNCTVSQTELFNYPSHKINRSNPK